MSLCREHFKKRHIISLLVLSALGYMVRYELRSVKDAHERSVGTSSSPSSSTSSATATATSPNTPPPVQHIFYLKTHKTGSTTMYCILAEFCRSHQLKPLLPRGNHINVFSPFRPGQLFLPRGGGGGGRGGESHSKYDMVFNHQIFNSSIMGYLHPDTFRLTTIREPARQFVSTVNFFSKNDVMAIPYLRKVPPEPDKVSAFLSNPGKYEVEAIRSLTNNRQSLDLGYDFLNHNFSDVEYIGRFVKQLDEFYDIVLISEYFDESLVMLRRLLRWTTQDIVYFRKLSSNVTAPPLTDVQIAQHKSISVADRALYDYFLPVFKRKMAEQSGLHEEVAEFKDILKRVSQFCEGLSDDNQDLLWLPAGKWSSSVSFTSSKCSWLRLDETNFTKYLRKEQKAQQKNITASNTKTVVM